MLKLVIKEAAAACATAAFVAMITIVMIPAA